MSAITNNAAWVSFCISTYRRPDFLREQLHLLLQQTDANFQVVISDNDPEGSAEQVSASFNDVRIKYFKNEENLGMIRSFNKSAERASTDYIVFVTDDDPIQKEFLATFKPFIDSHNTFSLYGGFIRPAKGAGELELIGKNDFLTEMLDPLKTTSILWSGCILRKVDAAAIGFIPDFGSPHLADHALLAMTGSVNGALVINKMYSHVTFHENNFSKFSFDYYVKGCEGFYNTISHFISARKLPGSSGKALSDHLSTWFISNFFNLKNYYLDRKDKTTLGQINRCAEQIIQFSFMKSVRFRYRIKSIILTLKRFIRK